MSVKELLTTFRDTLFKPVETAALSRILTRLDEILAAIEALQVADKITPAQAMIRVEWRACMFPLEQLVTIERLAPSRLRDEVREVESRLRENLQGLRRSACEGNAAEVLAAREPLVALRVRLETLGARTQAPRLHSRLLSNAVVASGLVGSLAAVYLRSDLGMRLLQVEGLFPAAAYQAIQTEGAALQPRADFLVDFMAEFSKHYFGHASQFSSIYYDPPVDGKPTERRTLQHKLSLRNASHGKVRYISSVEAIVRVTGEAEFPWHRLTVTPRVTIQDPEPHTPQKLTIKSDGIGPALDVRWVWQSVNGLVLAERQRPVFHQAEVAPYSALQVGVRPVRQGVIGEPFYFKLAQAPSAADPTRYLEVTAAAAAKVQSAACPPPPPEQYGWYEIIRTPAKLAAVTKIAHDEPWTLEVRYASLNSATEQLTRQRGRIDADLVFWAPRVKELYEWDPRCGPKLEVDRDGIMDHVDVPENLALIFADEKSIAQPKGVDLLTARLGLDLLDLPVGRRIAATTELNGFLNPQGILAVNLKLNMPARRSYEVTVAVNGEPAAGYRFAGLVPEFLSFEEEGEDRAVLRLRKVFGIPPTTHP